MLWTDCALFISNIICDLILVESLVLKRSPDITKGSVPKSEHVLRIDDHDFTMRPGFGGKITTKYTQKWVTDWGEILLAKQTSDYFAISSDLDVLLLWLWVQTKAIYLLKQVQGTYKNPFVLFTGPAVPVGVDVQVESLDTISEVDMVIKSGLVFFCVFFFVLHWWH